MRTILTTLLLSTVLVTQAVSQNKNSEVDSAKSTGSQTQALLIQHRQAIQLALREVEMSVTRPELSFTESVRLESYIALLGAYRAQEAAPLLVKNVARETVGLSYEVQPLRSLPSVGALVEIGGPSVQEILRRMKPLGEDIEYPENDLHLFAYIIRKVDGQEIGLLRLQLAAKDATGTHKLNLLNLTEIYEKRESEMQIRQAIEPKMNSQTPVAR